MRFLEHEAKAVLARYEIAAPRGTLVEDAEAAGHAARRLGGRVVLKGQYPGGGRMKAGAIRFASSPAEAQAAARDVFAIELAGRRADLLLVEEALDIAHEYYLGVTFDNDSGRPVIIVSTAGGIDVEDAPAGSVARWTLSNLLPTQNFLIKECIAELGVSGQELIDLTVVLSRLHRAFIEHDLLLAEVNPLAKTADGRWVALDCHMEMDDDATWRQAALLKELGIDVARRAVREPTELEQAAARIDKSDHRGVAGRLVEFEGELGLLIGGGGASLTAFDAVKAHGGSPANYCEIGGNPSVRKVAELTELLLSKPGVKRIAVIMNVVNNTRADIVARGVIKGCIGAGRVPAETVAVFRIPGAWEDEAVRLLTHYGVAHCDRTVSIDEAARRAVAQGD